MSGYYDWNDAEGGNKRSRGIWTHLHPHLVDTADLPTALAELEGQDLLGRDMSRRQQLHHGYVGEYPFGHHHGEALHTYAHEWTEPLSVPTEPASFDILGEYEYAPEPMTTISLDVPAPIFFGDAPGNLLWNGRNGWTDNTGQLVAVVRHTVNSGQNELTIETAWLENWLTANGKSLIWIENTGKDVYRGIGGGDTHPGALTRSHVHSWAPGTVRQTAPPGWQRIPARGE